MGISESVAMDLRRGFLWISFPASVTVDNYRQIEDKIESRLTGRCDKVVLDLEKTENIYSSGIGLIVRLKKQVAEAGGIFALVNVPKKLREILEGMHLEKVLPMFATDVEFEISQEEIWGETFAEHHPGFVFVAQIENGIYRLTLSGAMDALHDLSTVSEFKPVQSVSAYVLNLEGLDVMDTYGSQLLFELVQRIGKRGGKCLAYGASEMVGELLKLLSIDRFTQQFSSEKEALESIRK